MSEIGEILDRGRRGFEFFTGFLPLAQSLTEQRADLSTLIERYESERRLSLESIRGCRDHVLATRDLLADSLHVQLGIGESLEGVPGAEELIENAHSGTKLLERLDAVVAALTDVLEVIPDVVATKASRVAALDSDEVDGRSFDETEATVEAARRQESDALAWTEGIFLPTVDARVERFLSACDDGQNEIEDCFTRLAAALEEEPGEAVLLPKAGPL